MEISDDLACVFTARLEQRHGDYVIEVPSNEVALGDLTAGESYRIGVVQPASTNPREQRTSEAGGQKQASSEAPVSTGEQIDVEIEDIGEQGDGLARVGPGFIVFVPDTEIRDQVTVEIDEVKDTVAFGEVVEEQDKAPPKVS